MNVPKKYLFRFYQRGYNYDPRYDYIPDFKSTLEKESWEAGLKKKYYRSKSMKKKNPCGTKRKNPKRKLTDANGYLYMARYRYIHKGVKSKDLQTLYIVAFNVTEAYAKFEKYMNKWKKDIYLHYVEPKGFRVPVIT